MNLRKMMMSLRDLRKAMNSKLATAPGLAI